MPNNTPVILKDAQDFRELKHNVRATQRRIQSLARNLQHVSTRRHQTVWLPSQSDSRRFIAFITADPATVNASSLPACAVSDNTNVVTMNDSGSFLTNVETSVPVYNPFMWGFDNEPCYVVPHNDTWIIQEPVFFKMPSVRAETTNVSDSGFAPWDVVVETIAFQNAVAFDINSNVLRCIANSDGLGQQAHVTGRLELDLPDGDEYDVEITLNNDAGVDMNNRKQWRRTTGTTLMCFNFSGIIDMNNADRLWYTVSDQGTVTRASIDVHLI